MLLPCTVVDDDPVPALLTRRVMLIRAVSIDQPWVTLPARSPTVMTTRLDPLAPWPIRHLTDVSDSHCVASHPVSPCLDRPVYDTSPMLAPCTVTDVDPVPARLPMRAMLIDPRSDDHA
jgi:hypothetical protein